MTLPETADEVFEMFVSPEMHDFIYSSRDTAYTITEPELQFLLNDEALDLKEIKVRGKNALNYRRKSYAVKLNVPIVLEDREAGMGKVLTRFKLLALAMDHTYIENRLAFGILEETGLMPLFYKFVEFRINGSTQGVYLLMEDPEQYFRENGSEFILRRGYYNSIADAEYEPSLNAIPEETYLNRFREIYSLITELQGPELFAALSQRINLQQYFWKMGIDYLLRNGDYTDELFLYAKVVQDTIRYQLIPWDYDDIFSSQPHEVGLTWGTGKVFGTRRYETHQDILDEIGDKLIYSIEDDLDYIIARDPYLYERYEEALSNLFSVLKPTIFDVVFSQLESELTPFYLNEEVVAQSKFDRDASSYTLWKDNMQDKQKLLENRYAEMKARLQSGK
jgi:spore coat protein H